MAVLSIGDKRLGAVLLERGYVTDDALQQAIARHSEVGGRLADILMQLGVISEQRIARAVEESIGIPLVNLPRVDVMGDALAKVPGTLASELLAMPFALDGDRLRVAFVDPLDALLIEEVEDASGCLVEPYQALHKELQWALATYYPELGLEPPVDVDVDISQRLGNLAVGKGLITEQQLEDAIAEQQRTGGLLGRILVQMGHLAEDALAQLLAQQMNIEYVPDLDDEAISDKLGTTLLRLDAVQFSAVPYKMEDDVLVVAGDSTEVSRLAVEQALQIELVHELLDLGGHLECDIRLEVAHARGRQRRQFEVAPQPAPGNAEAIADGKGGAREHALHGVAARDQARGEGGCKEQRSEEQPDADLQQNDPDRRPGVRELRQAGTDHARTAPAPAPAGSQR